MRIIKFVLIIVLVLTCIGGGLYYVSLHLRPGQMPVQLASLQVLQPFIQSGLSKATQSLPSSTQIGNVLGAKSEVSNGGTSVPQHAFETARYTYCQTVIKDYEQRYETVSSKVETK